MSSGHYLKGSNASTDDHRTLNLMSAHDDPSPFPSAMVYVPGGCTHTGLNDLGRADLLGFGTFSSAHFTVAVQSDSYRMCTVTLDPVSLGSTLTRLRTVLTVK